MHDLQWKAGDLSDGDDEPWSEKDGAWRPWHGEKDERSLSTAELKEMGNKAFALKNFDRAARLYSRAISAAETGGGAAKSEIWRSAILNRAACRLELGSWEAVYVPTAGGGLLLSSGVTPQRSQCLRARFTQVPSDHSVLCSCADCGAVLEVEPENTKALFRRGRAMLLLDEPAKARVDLLRAARLMPTNKAIRAELDVANAALKADSVAPLVVRHEEPPHAHPRARPARRADTALANAGAVGRRTGAGGGAREDAPLARISARSDRRGSAGRDMSNVCGSGQSLGTRTGSTRVKPPTGR